MRFDFEQRLAVNSIAQELRKAFEQEGTEKKAGGVFVGFLPPFSVPACSILLLYSTTARLSR
jgi:hypothetical protein